MKTLAADHLDSSGWTESPCAQKWISLAYTCMHVALLYVCNLTMLDNCHAGVGCQEEDHCRGGKISWIFGMHMPGWWLFINAAVREVFNHLIKLQEGNRHIFTIRDQSGIHIQVDHHRMPRLKDEANEDTCTFIMSSVTQPFTVFPDQSDLQAQKQKRHACKHLDTNGGCTVLT